MTESPVQAARSVSDLIAENAMHGEAKLPDKRFWTGREIKALKGAFPAGGLAACLQVLPGRSASSIYQKARLEGLVSPATAKRGPVPRQRWRSNEHIDRIIVEAYGRVREAKDIVRLAKTVGRPRWWVGKRAAALGCISPRFRESAWSEAEIALVAEQAHRRPSFLRALLKRNGFVRSETAIAVKLKRIEADREDPDHCTATGLAGIMGVDAKTVSGWIAKGWLTASRRGTERVAAQGGDQWWIDRRHIARFIVENVAAINFCKVDKFWLVELLTTEGRAGAKNGADA